MQNVFLVSGIISFSLVQSSVWQLFLQAAPMFCFSRETIANFEILARFSKTQAILKSFKTLVALLDAAAHRTDTVLDIPTYVHVHEPCLLNRTALLLELR